MGRFPSVARGVDLSGGRAITVEAKRRRRGALFRSAEATSAAPCAAALPIHAAFLRRLATPLQSMDKARRVLPSMLDIELPFPLESCAHAFLDLARTPQGNVETLAVAARMEDVAAHLERQRAAGFNPTTIEHEAVALWRQSVEEAPIAHSQRRILIYLSEDRIGLVSGGGSGLETATGLRLGAHELLDPQSSGARRLALWCRTQREKHPDDIWHLAWCGPGADRPELRAALAAILTGGAELKNITHREPAAFLARGLAAGLVSGASAEGNLRQGALAHPDIAAASRRQSRGRWIGLGAAALLLIAVNLAWMHHLTRARDQWQERLYAEARLVAGTDRLPRGQELLTAERALESQAAGWTLFQHAMEPGAQVVLAQLLRAATPYDMTFHNLIIRPQSLVIHGTAGDWSHGERLSAALAGNGWKTQLERSDAGADERVHFTLKGDQ